MKRWGRFILLAVLLIIVLAFYLTLSGKHSPERQATGDTATGTTAEIAQALKPMGCTLTIPEGMTLSRKAMDFLWFTDNGASIMRNICLYSYPAERLDSSVVISRRDSVMRLNIPGETDGMHVETDSRMPVRHTLTPEGRLRTEGTWEMKGDMMGGPFVCHSIYDPQNRRVIVAEAFLFAPDRDKATAMKRLEEILFTLRPAD